VPILRKAMLAGTAALAVAAFSGVAAAQSRDTHVLNVQLPGGGVARIVYTGDVPPRVTFSSGPTATDVLPTVPSMFGPSSPFAELERISAEMDRQAAIMLRRAAAMMAQPLPGPGQLTEAALRNLPPGTESYSVVSTMSGGNVCTRSVQITSTDEGAAPRVVSHSSGNCGPEAGGATGSVNLPTVPAPAKRPDTLWVKNDGTQPYSGMVQKTADRSR
jgi:hypothetical protein